uniref:Uncharacterized protein n=1 Tax=Astyanax mexicanus TaxID=7994 RepID=A0A3B1KH56_ASTMX
MHCPFISSELIMPNACLCLCVSPAVCICKLAEGEHPLLLRLLAGPSTDTLSFVLREQQTGEWDAFSIPELHNFLRILDKEEQDQVHVITTRYNIYREKLEAAIQAVSSPD